MEKKSIFKRFLYSQKAAPYVFVLPFVLTFLIFFAYPIIDIVIMSFQKVSGGGNEWVGLKNYQTLMNPVFYKALKNSILYMILSCAIMIPIPMFLATALNSKAMKAKGFFRSIMFIPALTSVVVAGVIFRLMFGELDGSFMNQVIQVFGMEPIVWLRRVVPVWIALLLLCLWRWTGVNMMYYLSGLQQIPDLTAVVSVHIPPGGQHQIVPAPHPVQRLHGAVRHLIGGVIQKRHIHVHHGGQAE